jgi:hypothetical protein
LLRSQSWGAVPASRRRPEGAALLGIGLVAGCAGPGRHLEILPGLTLGLLRLAERKISGQPSALLGHGWNLIEVAPSPFRDAERPAFLTLVKRRQPATCKLRWWLFRPAPRQRGRGGFLLTEVKREAARCRRPC